MSDEARGPLVVGISGASGIVHGVRILDACRELGVATHLIVSRAAVLTLAQETDLSIDALNAKATIVHRIGDVGATVASGSFVTRGMVVAPCSIRSLGEIATGVTSSLLTRTADVTLKERRRLVLMVRETPLHLGHLRAMAAVTEMGAIVAPPMAAFYAKPRDLAEMVDQTVGRVLDLFGLEWGRTRRWSGMEAAS
jgi:4-hydroxy-3-polyprenylbenzoate decarboxylase